MKYRPITKLTNREITEAMTRFFDVDEKEIYGIKRQNNPIPQVNVKVGIDDENAVWTAMRDPFESCPWFSDNNHRVQYYQWCLAKGVCIWLKDNPYMEAENAD